MKSGLHTNLILVKLRNIVMAEHLVNRTFSRKFLGVRPDTRSQSSYTCLAGPTGNVHCDEVKVTAAMCDTRVDERNNIKISMIGYGLFPKTPRG
jgi:hypothetical protein